MNQNFDQLPQGLDQATLLALVEGALTPAQVTEARRNLSLSPELAASIDGMIADRRALASLPPVPVPEGLVEAAMARSRTEAMTSLKFVEAQPGPIAISTILNSRQGWWNRTKVAAALLVATGSVFVYFSTRGGKGQPQPTDPRMITKREPSHGSISGPELPITLSNPTIETPDLHVPADEVPDAPLTLAASSGPAVVFPMLPADAGEARLQRALDLAREGRLVIRVIARTPASIQSEVAAISTRRESGRIWTLSREAPAEIALAVARPPALAPHPEEPAAAPAFANEQWQVPMKRVPAIDVTTRGIEVPPQREDISLASISPSISALQSLQTVLTERLGAVEFAELGSPAQSAQPAAVTAESVLWWTQPPAQWSAWIDVPVVIERR